MKSFQRKKSWRTILQSRVVLAVLIVLLIFCIWNMTGFLGRAKLAWDNRKIAEDRLNELEQKEKRLSSDLAKLKTESGVEETIRTKFGLAKEGEGVIVVVPDKEKDQSEQPQNSGFFSFFTNWFK